MHRFHIPPERCQGSRIILEDKEAHHALHVLRAQTGDHITVLDGAGGRYLCEITAASRKSIELALLEKSTQPAPTRQITLFQAIPKGKTFEYIVQKATEMGVSRIIPLRSERCEVHLDPKQAARKTEKWRSVMLESIKQCGNPWLPTLDPAAHLDEILTQENTHDLSLLASLEDTPIHPRQRFSEFRRQHNRSPRSIAIWIGPEGDFSDPEREAIKQTGALPFSLGPLILRADTAAIASIAILNHELTAKD